MNIVQASMRDSSKVPLTTVRKGPACEPDEMGESRQCKPLESMSSLRYEHIPLTRSDWRRGGTGITGYIAHA